jgi:hypothetical protein
VHILIAALIGVVVSVGITLVVDAIRGKKPTGKELLASAVGGLIGGAITAATLGTGGFAAATIARGVTASIAGGAAGGGSGQIAANVTEGRPVLQNVPEATAIGGVLGGGLYGAGRAAAPVLGRVFSNPAAARAVEPVPVDAAPSVAPGVESTASSGGIPTGGRGIRGALLGEGEREIKVTPFEPGTTKTSGSSPPASEATVPATKGPNGALGETPQAKPGPRFPESRKPAAQTAEPPTEAPATSKASYDAWKKAIPTPGLKDPVADVAYFTKDVPALEGDLAALKAKGWKIVYNEPGQGSWCNAEKVPPEIVIDPEGGPMDTLKTLAHEVGHANEAPTPFRDPQAMTQADYVATRLHDMALSEGQAVLNEATTLQTFRQAVVAETGQAPQLPYQGIYRTIAMNNSLTTAQKIEQIGLKYMQNEVPSVGTGEKNYNGYWSDLFSHEWDVAHGLAKPD